MQSVENQVEASIIAKERGELFFSEGFMNVGSPEAIRKALERLTKKAVIVRVAQGIYVRPLKYLTTQHPPQEGLKHSQHGG